ncbi:MAG: 2-phospho-L-lactate guanylyltransferase [Bryobacteraceae bacterium]
MPDTWALVPIKSLDNGKTRLSSLLDPGQRAELIPAMAEDVLDAFADYGRMPVLVVTADSRVPALAKRRGFQCLMEESPESETKAIEVATQHASSLGAGGTLVVPADVPLVQAADIAAIAENAPARGSLLVPAWDGRGTNAVVRRPCGLFPLRFGNDSFLPHHAAAKETALPLVVQHNDHLALDIDAPADLFRFLDFAAPMTRTRRVLDRFRLERPTE